MKKLIPSNKIYIKDSEIAKNERGVFAFQKIKKNELIERCPIIKIEEEDPSNSKSGILITYFFYFDEDKKGQAIALGFGSIYNHTRNPNAVYNINQKEEIIDFIALKNIEQNEEITVNYNWANQNDKTPMWFEDV